MRRTPHAALAFCLGVGLVLAAFACESKLDYPPVPPNPYEVGSLSPGTSGGGGGVTETACTKQGGLCTAAGNLCPILLGTNLCGSASEGDGAEMDGESSGQICCTGYNDAGAVDDSGD
jgi:hypothetical protein